MSDGLQFCLRKLPYKRHLKRMQANTNPFKKRYSVHHHKNSKGKKEKEKANKDYKTKSTIPSFIRSPDAAKYFHPPTRATIH